MLSSKDAHVRWYWTLGVQLTIHNQSLAALPASRPNIHQSEEDVLLFLHRDFFANAVHWMSDPACLQGKVLLKIYQLSLSKVLSPSRRFSPEVNPKHYDVKGKYSIGSWQDFDTFCVSEGNDRSKKTHEYSSSIGNIEE